MLACKVFRNSDKGVENTINHFLASTPLELEDFKITQTEFKDHIITTFIYKVK